MNEQQLIEYMRDNFDTDLIEREGKFKRLKTGRMAGHKHFNTGYIRLSIYGRQYYAHRLVFLFCNGAFPVRQTDHINGIKHDNRIENLRDVSRSENMRNKGMQSNNKSGVCGLDMHKLSGTWRCQVHNGDRYIAKHFKLDQRDEAIAYLAEAHAANGYTARHGTKSR